MVLPGETSSVIAPARSGRDWSRAGGDNRPSPSTARPPNRTPAVAASDGAVSERIVAAPVRRPTCSLIRDMLRSSGVVVDDYHVDVTPIAQQRDHIDVRRTSGSDGAHRAVANQFLAQQQRIPLRLSGEGAVREPLRGSSAYGRVAMTVGWVALKVDACGTGGHRPSDVTDCPKRRGERIADASLPTAGHRVCLIDAQADGAGA